MDRRAPGGRAQAHETPVGSVPTPTALDVDGLNLPPGALEAVLTVDAEEWQAELALIEDWFTMLARGSRRATYRARRPG